MPLSYKYDPQLPPQALVLGAMNLDIQAIASQQAVPADSTPGKVSTSAGGVGRNIAESLSRLGIATTLVSAVADDYAGRQLLKDCAAAGINVANARPVKGFDTPTYVSVFDGDGGLLQAVSDMQLIERPDCFNLSSVDQLMHGADLCVIDSNLAARTITHIAENIEQQLFAADAVSVAKCHRLSSILPKLSLVKVNRIEASALTNMKEDAPPDALVENLLQLGPQNVLLTLGDQGAVLGTMTDSWLTIHKIAAPDSEIVSVNGAGDALMAGVLAAVMYGEDTVEQLRWGSVCASISLSTHKACSENLTLLSVRS